MIPSLARDDASSFLVNHGDIMLEIVATIIGIVSGCRRRHVSNIVHRFKENVFPALVGACLVG